MVNRWDDDSDGFAVGLLDEGPRPGVKVSRRDVKTRHARAYADWTPNDITAEFCDRLVIQAPALLGYLGPIQKRGVIVAAARKRLRTTPEVEVALIDLFLVEESNVKFVISRPASAVQTFVGTWVRNMGRARELAGLPPLGLGDGPQDAPEAESVAEAAPAATEAPRGLLVASDGEEFPDTTLGRSRLDEYEDYLREVAA